MRGPVLAVCDRDKNYCIRLSEYLRRNSALSFNIQAFTDIGQLNNYLEKEKAALLVISESAYESEGKDIKDVENLLILTDEGKSVSDLNESDGTSYLRDYRAQDMKIYRISKFVPAKEILQKVLDICTGNPGAFSDLKVRGAGERAKVFGFFTPISRSGQTTLAIKMGEELAKRGKTVFISLESFSSVGEKFGDGETENLTDLLYYADCERDKFAIYLERIKKSSAGLDYILPPVTAMQIKEIGKERLSDLIDLLGREGGYENIVLDIKEYASDFFEILSMCDVLYTIVRKGRNDEYRLGLYNRALAESGCEEIIAGTLKCSPPDHADRASYENFVRALILQGMEVKNLGA